jgi:hypothetical protein
MDPSPLVPYRICSSSREPEVRPVITSTPPDQLAEDARRGQETFDQHIRHLLRPEDDGKFVAIDIDTGTYKIDANDYAATGQLLARLPTARVWLMRTGQATTVPNCGQPLSQFLPRPITAVYCSLAPVTRSGSNASTRHPVRRPCPCALKSFQPFRSMFRQIPRRMKAQKSDDLL